MRQEVIFESGDKIKLLQGISYYVKSEAHLITNDPLNKAEVTVGMKVPAGTRGTVNSEAKNFKGYYHVLFEVESSGPPYQLQVLCHVHGKLLEFIPPEEKPVSSIEGDTFTAHGNGPGK